MTNFTDSQATERPVMSRSLLFLAILLATPPRVHAQLTVDTTGAGALIAQAMDHSEVMANLRELSDVIGPRLSGSAAMRRANDWTAERFRAYGLTASAGGLHLRRHLGARVGLPPADRAVHPSDHGTELGLDRRHRRQDAHRAGGAGGPVHAGQPGRVQGQGSRRLGPAARRVSALEPGRPPMTAADSRDSGRRPSRRAGRRRRTRRAAAVLARRQFALDLPYVLKTAGALGTLVDGVQGARPDDHERLAQPGVTAAQPRDRARGLRACSSGRSSPASTRGSRARWRTRIGRAPVQQWNTVAEIRGSERPGQVVILGAHLDSWDLGHGRHRQRHRLDGRARGRAGARAVGPQAEADDPVHPVQRRRGGTARLAGLRRGACGRGGQHSGGAGARQRDRTRSRARRCRDAPSSQDLWQRPARAGGLARRRQRARRVEDRHRPPVASCPTACPGFNFDQLPRGYHHTHHSQSDTYDKAVPGDLRAGRGGHGGDGVRAGEPAGAAAARAEARAGDGAHQAVSGGRRRTHRLRRQRSA